jgi:hypothetical protein
MHNDVPVYVFAERRRAQTSVFLTTFNGELPSVH